MNQPAYEITGRTRLICLLGDPVAHSKSPMMHNEGFSQLGLDYCYLAFQTDEASLKQTVEGLKRLNCRGFNLTMPCKNKMAALCDHLSPAAKISGSVNTVVNDNGILTGHTTDGLGFLNSLQESGQDYTGKKMVLLGAGGAGTAILVQAALDGMREVSVFSRSTSPLIGRTRQIADTLNEQTNCHVRLFDYEEDILRREIASAQILTNSTNVGMAPHTEQSILPDSSYFHKDLFVADVIYNPAETRFLKLARQAGCQTINGLPMLLYQGAEAFRLWTGETLPVDIVREKYFQVAVQPCEDSDKRNR